MTVSETADKAQATRQGLRQVSETHHDPVSNVELSGADGVLSPVRDRTVGLRTHGSFGPLPCLTDRCPRNERYWGTGTTHGCQLAFVYSGAAVVSA